MKKLISFLFFLTLIMLSMLNFDSEAREKKERQNMAIIVSNLPAQK